MIRVLHVTTGGRMGGAERLIVDVLRAGRSLELWDASVCILTTADELGRQLRADGFEVIALGARGPRQLASATPRLAGLIRRGRYDVVHGHLLHGAAFGLLAARAVGHPCAVMTRHYERFVSMYGSTTDRILHWIGHRLARHVFAISKASRSVLIDLDHVSASRVTVVANGLDEQRVRAQAGERRHDDEHFTIGSVGALHPRKGHGDLIAAFARAALGDTARLVLVGDGPARADLETLARQLGVAERVRFVGYEPEPYPLMRSLDLYVQPSREEGFGIAVLEAMALGLPVIASDAGGLPEIVDGAETGVLFRAGDVTMLAHEISLLATDAARRSRLGASGQSRVGSVFSARTTARGYAEGYRALLSRPSEANPTMM